MSQDKPSKTLIIIFFVVFVLFLVIWSNADSIRNKLALRPLLDASEKASGIRMSCAQDPERTIDESGRSVLLIWLKPNINRKAPAEERADTFEMQVKGINEYLAANPDYFTTRDNYAVEMHLGWHGEEVIITNSESYEYGEAYSADISNTLCHTQAGIHDISLYGNSYISDMRSFYFDDWENKGRFLETVGDPSVLENLERIGPKSNFSAEELAWFAENLPDCEIVDTETGQTS